MLVIGLVGSIFGLQYDQPAVAAVAAVLVLAAFGWCTASGRRSRALAKRLLAHPYGTFGEAIALLEGTAGLSPPDEVIALIARLLDEMEPEEIDRLSPQHVDALHRFIAVFHGEDPSLAYSGGPGNALKMAALRVLGSVGDAATLRAVDELLKVERDLDVQGAAWECREILEHRLSQRDPSTVLLRPASASSALLRRAPIQAGSMPEVLLRPAEDEEGAHADRHA